MIHRLHNMIGDCDTQVMAAQGDWCRAVPEPLPLTLRERVAAAWAVLMGAAHAVAWPKPGELERAYHGRR